MSTAAIVAVIVAAVVVVLIVVAVLGLRRRAQSRRLQEHFGGEYDRMVDQTGDRRTAEQVLSERVDQRQKLQLSALSSSDRDRFEQEWRTIQADFVDAPSESLDRADVLLNQVMRARGYPVDEFDQRADLISVDHPDLVRNYRQAHAIQRGNGEGRVTTEDARQALVSYRSLFAELLEAPGDRRNEMEHR